MCRGTGLGTFEPQIVRKRQRRLSGVDEMVLALYAKGLTTSEISAHYPRRVRPAAPSRARAPVLGEEAARSAADGRVAPS
jgi:transposase-like protein